MVAIWEKIKFNLYFTYQSSKHKKKMKATSE